jgi:hypothetical protein
MGLYRMIIPVQRDDSHHRNCNRLTPCVNIATSDLFEKEMFALQVNVHLEQQITRVQLEWKNTNTEQNWEMLSEETILSNISKTLVCKNVL